MQEVSTKRVLQLLVMAVFIEAIDLYRDADGNLTTDAAILVSGDSLLQVLIEAKNVKRETVEGGLSDLSYPVVIQSPTRPAIIKK